MTFRVLALVLIGCAVLPPIGRGAPVPPPRLPAIELVLCIDTTKDMAAALAAVQQHFPAICAAWSGGRLPSRVRVGLVAYRDRGEEYETRVFPLSEDLRAVGRALEGLSAEGGGDAPEGVNRALHQTIHHLAWSGEPGVRRVVLLLGSAPPHADEDEPIAYLASCAAARARGIVIHAVQVGHDQECAECWGAIARQTGGRYWPIGNGCPAAAIRHLLEPAARPR